MGLAVPLCFHLCFLHKIYLGWIGVDDSDIHVAMGSLEHNLLHIASYHSIMGYSKLGIDEMEEFVDVP